MASEQVTTSSVSLWAGWDPAELSEEPVLSRAALRAPCEPGRGPGSLRAGFWDVLGGAPRSQLERRMLLERRGAQLGSGTLGQAEFPPPRGQRPGTARPGWLTSPAGSAGPGWPEPQECCSTGCSDPALLDFSSFKNIL